MTSAAERILYDEVTTDARRETIAILQQIVEDQQKIVATKDGIIEHQDQRLEAQGKSIHGLEEIVWHALTALLSDDRTYREQVHAVLTETVKGR
jgi:hypothetical protein